MRSVLWNFRKVIAIHEISIFRKYMNALVQRDLNINQVIYFS